MKTLTDYLKRLSDKLETRKRLRCWLVLLCLALSPGLGRAEPPRPASENQASGFLDESIVQLAGDPSPKGEEAPLALLAHLVGFALVIGLLVILLRRSNQRTKRHYSQLNKFQKFTRLAPIPVVFLKNNRMVYFNRDFIRLFGYKIDDIPDVETWFKTFYPDPHYRQWVRAEWDEHVRGKIETLEIPRIFEMVTKDREIIKAEFYIIFLDDGHIIMTIEDLTNKNRLEEQRLQQDQIESASLFAGRVAHDFNNILTNLLGLTNLLQLEEGNSPKQVEYLAAIETAIKRASGVARQLQDFSHGEEPRKKLVVLEPLIRETVNLTLNAPQYQTQLEIEPELPAIEVDEIQISQALTNLLINAKQSMPEGGEIRLTAHKICQQELPAKPKNGLVERWIKLDVSDDGPGIPINERNQIFTPYFTSKKHGSGLGLSSAWKIINKHGGVLRLSSPPGPGTTFSIYLPAALSKPS